MGVVLLGFGLLAACSTSGRDLEPPAFAAPVVAPVAGSIPVAPLVTGVGGFSLSLRRFEPGTAIDEEHTLRGGNEIPPLEWSAVPVETAELAITLQDFDLDGQYRWVLIGVPPTEPGLTGGLLPVGSRSIETLLGDGYQGPAAPLGVAHRYVFTIYALDSALNVAEGVTDSEVIEQIGQHAIATASITATHTGT